MAASNNLLDVLSHEQRWLVESWLVRFEQAWDEERLPAQLSELPTDPSLRRPLLIEMVKIDLERQWQRNRRLPLEDYLSAYPELGSADTVPADLLQAEYEVRRQFDPTADLADYAHRFPRQAEALRRLLEESASRLSKPGLADPVRVTPAGNPSTVASDPSECPGLPERFGRYRILQRLGQGGMGAVYLAHDTQLDRAVALKVPRFSAQDDPALLERFYREARAAANLSHPNLCPVHDVGQIDGTHYLTMAYIEGQSLADRIHRGWTPAPREAAELVRKVALAVGEAHVHGVIHRDLKPSNIMLNRRGEPVVMDFGLARRIKSEDVRLTQRGSLIGTPAYMPPEQVAGDINRMGPVSDVYSLGVILYEMLTGKLPFDGTLGEVMARILTEQPAPPSVLRPEVEPRLETVCLKAMAKKVEDRYRSMTELAVALADCLQAPTQPVGPPPSAAPDTVSLPAPPRRSRSRKLWTAAAAGVVAVLLLAGVVLYVTTNKGTIKIDIDDKDAVVRIDGEVVTIEHLGEPIPLRVGEHELMVTRDDTVLQTRKFTVHRGGNPVLRVELVRRPPEPEKPDATTSDVKGFQGIWKAVVAERDGEPLLEGTIQKTNLTFRGNQFTFQMGEESFEGTQQLDPTKKPRTVNVTFTGGPDKGKTVLGIYELEGDRLKLCWSEPGRPRPTDFATKPDTGHNLLVLQRKEPPTPAPPGEHSLAVQALVKSLTDEDAAVRRDAALGLKQLKDTSAVPALIRALADEKWFGRPYVLQVGDSSDNYDPVVRNAILEALQELAPEKVIEALLAAIKAKNDSVRRWACGHLGSRRNEKAVVQALGEALSDHSAPVRRDAARSLKKLGDPSAVPALIRALADEKWFGRPYVFQVGDSSDNYDPVVRNAALEALRELAPNRVTEALLAATESKNALVKAWALNQATNQKDKK